MKEQQKPGRRFGGRKKAVAVLILAFLLTPSAFAIFGVGDVVFDPAVVTSLHEILAAIGIHASISADTLAKTGKILDQAVKMAQIIPTIRRGGWATVVRGTVQDHTKNTSGETGGWAEAANGIPSMAEPAWNHATLAVHHFVAPSSDQIGNSATLSTLASIETIDGSSTKCLETIAGYRGYLPVKVAKLAALQFAQASDSDSDNSQVSQLNLLNSAANQNAVEQHEQGALKACEVEQRIIASKVQRDQLAEHLNFTTGVQQHAAEDNAGFGSMADAFTRRLP